LGAIRLPETFLRTKGCDSAEKKGTRNKIFPNLLALGEEDVLVFLVCPNTLSDQSVLTVRALQQIWPHYGTHEREGFYAFPTRCPIRTRIGSLRA
jgi:hypothetical protein